MCGIWLYLSKLLEGKYTSGELYNAFYQIQKRGPDRSKFIELNSNSLKMNIGFHRLAIMDVSTKGDQPFVYENNGHTIYSMTNGEIYNYSQICSDFNFNLKSGSDCEVVPLLYMTGGIDLILKTLDGEWALIIVDINHKTGETIIYNARDQSGVRPLFYSDDENGIGFSSEMKGLIDIASNIKPFPPLSYMTTIIDKEMKIKQEFKEWYSYDFKINDKLTMDVIKDSIRTLITQAVVSRLESDRPIGCLLSGGIDSSLVAAISAKYLAKKGIKLKTFSIGISDSPDVYYGKMVAEYIGSDHTIVPFDPIEGIKLIPTVIQAIESYDITTVRASVAMYMLLDYIRKKTDVKVVHSGEYSDEIAGGYIFYHNAPSKEEFNNECIKQVKDIYMYDSLRADRCIANNGIEARVPFSSKNFVEFMMSIDPELRRPRPSELMGIKDKIEKPLLREAFYDTGLLPKEIVQRGKSALSDAISNDSKSWYEYIEEYVNTIITDKEYEENKQKYNHVQPTSKEALYYRQVFEATFNKQSDNSNVIPYFWLPKWSGDIQNPSARVLSVYKKETV